MPTIYKTIDDLDAGAAISDSDLFEAFQTDAGKKVLASALLTYIEKSVLSFNGGGSLSGGTVDANAQLALDTNAFSLMQILGGAAHDLGFLLGPASNPNICRILYNTSDDNLEFWVGDVQRAELTTDGHMKVTNGLFNTAFVQVAAATENAVFDTLSVHVPNINDVVQASGSIEQISTGYIFNVCTLKRTGATTIQFQGFRTDINAIASVTFTDGNANTNDIAVSI